jgi:hypothetical protein
MLHMRPRSYLSDSFPLSTILSCVQLMHEEREGVVAYSGRVLWRAPPDAFGSRYEARSESSKRLLELVEVTYGTSVRRRKLLSGRRKVRQQGPVRGVPLR